VGDQRSMVDNKCLPREMRGDRRLHELLGSW